MDLKSELWSEKTVLVTGHTGFKGSWLSVLLGRLGAKVVGMSLEAQGPNSLYKDGNLASFMEAEYMGDIRDEKLVSKVFEEHQIDYVFHLAAQALVRDSIRNPLESVTTNVVGTTNVLLSALKANSVIGITLVTTDKVYRNHDWVWPYRESDQLGGNEPYSASKAASELIVHAICISNNPRKVPVTTARAGNVIGGGDWGKERLVPDLVRASAQSKILQIRNPLALRPWQYVLDCLTGYLLLGQAHLESRVDVPRSLNFGPSSSMSVKELINMFNSHLEIKYEMDISGEGIKEHGRLALDSHLSEEYLGWATQYSIEESVARTAFWYRSFLAGVDVPKLMIDEIDLFFRGKI
jgi:CDP-glucose 4,6-dehydratase